MEDFESYSLLLSTIAQRMLVDRGDVEDIVQEAYLRYATAAVPEIGSLKTILSPGALSSFQSDSWKQPL